jgi:L-ascorbate metabolism protein UlaG (beta-lactamase superfamily)
VEIVHRVSMPGKMLTAEMSPREGAMAAQWLDLETALPCHYINPDCDDVREFVARLEAAKARGERVPKRVPVLKPGEFIEFE